MKRIDIENAPGFLVGRVAHHLELHVRKFISEADIQLSAAELTILTALAHLDSAKSMGSLAELLGCDPTTLKRQLNRPLKAGLVDRKPSKKDRRVLEITITAKGKAVTVGIQVTLHPPYRSQRALLTHWAPTLGFGVKAVNRLRVQDSNRGNISFHQQ